MNVDAFLKHAIGHNKALAQSTTSPDTSLFLAGDSFHHPSELQPTPTLLVPKKLDLPAFGGKIRPCQISQNLKPKRQLGSSFGEPNDSFSHNSEQAIETTVKI